MYPAYSQHCFSLWGLVHIYIPQTGTPCGRIVGQRSYMTLMGLAFGFRLALPFCTLIVSQLGGFVKRFFLEVSTFFYLPVLLATRAVRFIPCGGGRVSLPSWLLLHCITTWAICQGVFPTFSHLFTRELLGRILDWDFPLPLTLQIIAHLPTECNRQNAQNRDFYFLDICATFCLTNCWWCVIMEISRPSTVGAPPKSRLIVD